MACRRFNCHIEELAVWCFAIGNVISMLVAVCEYTRFRACGCACPGALNGILAVKAACTLAERYKASSTLSRIQQSTWCKSKKSSTYKLVFKSIMAKRHDAHRHVAAYVSCGSLVGGDSTRGVRVAACFDDAPN